MDGMNQDTVKSGFIDVLPEERKPLRVSIRSLSKMDRDRLVRAPIAASPLLRRLLPLAIVEIEKVLTSANLNDLFSSFDNSILYQTKSSLCRVGALRQSSSNA
jgi:hypothetical protein